VSALDPLPVLPG